MKAGLTFLVLALVLQLMPTLARASEGAPSQVDTAMIAQRIAELTNEARVRKGLTPVTNVDYLARAATEHSQEMLSRGYFSHTSPSAQRSTPKKRIILAGGWDTETGENIYRCTGISAEDVAQCAVAAWLASPHHYKNLMAPSYNSMGVGVVRQGDTYCITQDFSNQSIEVVSLSSSGSGGDQVNLVLRGRVRQGSAVGAIFINGVQDGAFQAAADGGFVARVIAPAGSIVSLGQQKAERTYRITLLLPALPLSGDPR